MSSREQDRLIDNATYPKCVVCSSRCSSCLVTLEMHVWCGSAGILANILAVQMIGQEVLMSSMMRHHTSLWHVYIHHVPKVLEHEKLTCLC